MKLAVSSVGPKLDSPVDPRFGRCAYFLFIDSHDLSFEAVDNTNSSLGGGAGIQAAKLVVTHGAKVVLTGNCGPNAHQTLSAAGVEVIVGCGGTVAEVVQQYNDGKLRPSSSPNVVSHAGQRSGG